MRAIPEAYDRVIELALANAVDFVVIAGDVFDSGRPSFGDFTHFFDGIARLGQAGIPVYITCGNHDPFASWRNDVDRLPGNAHLLGAESPEFVLHERDGEPLCLIGARSYRNQAWPIDRGIAEGISRSAAIRALRNSHPNAADAPFSIGIVHTALRPDQSKAYTNEDDLLAADIDYWACGHLHRHLALPDGHAPRIGFPGNIQGRKLREDGERGCYLVEMSEGIGRTPRIDVSFQPTASVVFHAIDVDIAACQTLSDVSRTVRAALFRENAQDRCEEMVVRVNLVGTTDLHAYLRQPGVTADMRKKINDTFPTFYCDALVDRTQPIIDRDAHLREGLFTSHVLRVANRQATHETEMLNFIQSEFVKRGIGVPDSLAGNLASIESAAESIVFDLLAGENA